jgi:hypothetical protein
VRRRSGWCVVALASLLGATLGATPARGDDVRYEGRRELVRGATACASQSGEISMAVGDDGGVRGEVVTTDGALPFYGTLSPAGLLTANFRAATGVEAASLEGKIGDDGIHGFTLSRTCRHRFLLKRR